MNSYVDEVVRKKIDAIEAGNNVYEMGRVRNVQSYMLEISGMENAAYFDRVIIESPGDIPKRFLRIAQTISVPAVVPLNLKTRPSPMPMKRLPMKMKKKKSCVSKYWIVAESWR